MIRDESLGHARELLINSSGRRCELSGWADLASHLADLCPASSELVPAGTRTMTLLVNTAHRDKRLRQARWPCCARAASTSSLWTRLFSRRRPMISIDYANYCSHGLRDLHPIKATKTPPSAARDCSSPLTHAWARSQTIDDCCCSAATTADNRH
jgi:hypothetical protein